MVKILLTGAARILHKAGQTVEVTLEQAEKLVKHHVAVVVEVDGVNDNETGSDDNDDDDGTNEGGEGNENNDNGVGSDDNDIHDENSLSDGGDGSGGATVGDDPDTLSDRPNHGGTNKKRGGRPT